MDLFQKLSSEHKNDCGVPRFHIVPAPMPFSQIDVTTTSICHYKHSKKKHKFNGLFLSTECPLFGYVNYLTLNLFPIYSNLVLRNMNEYKKSLKKRR